MTKFNMMIKNEEALKLLQRYKFDFNITNYSDLTCIICKNIMINAHKSLCQCTYCLECFEEYFDENTRYCPGSVGSCRQPIQTVMEYMQFDKERNDKILEIAVKCPLEECKFHDTLKNMKDHIVEHETLADKIGLVNGGSADLSSLADSLEQLKQEISYLVEDSDKKTRLIEKLWDEVRNLGDFVRQEFVEMKGGWKKRDGEVTPLTSPVEIIGKQEKGKLDKSDIELSNNQTGMKLNDRGSSKQTESRETKQSGKTYLNKNIAINYHTKKGATSAEKTQIMIQNLDKSPQVLISGEEVSEKRDGVNDKSDGIQVRKKLKISKVSDVKMENETVVKPTQPVIDEIGIGRLGSEDAVKSQKPATIETSHITTASELRMKFQRSGTIENFNSRTRNPLNPEDSNRKILNETKVKSEKSVNKKNSTQLSGKENLGVFQTIGKNINVNKMGNEESIRPQQSANLVITISKQTAGTNQMRINENMRKTTNNNGASIPMIISDNQDIAPYIWQVVNLRDDKNPQMGIQKDIFSKPFYSHHNGYKMTLIVHKNPTQLVFGFGICKGEYDNSLQWPMRNDVTISLLYHESSFQYGITKFKIDNSFNHCPITSVSESKKDLFDLKSIYKNPKLFKNNSIILRCSVDVSSDY